MDSLNQIDQNGLTTLLGGSNGSLIPDSLVTTMTVSFIVLNVLGVLFFVFYVVSIIRKWKVQSAVLHMQKDLAEIKESLIVPKPELPPSPLDSNNHIASLGEQTS